MGNEAGTCVSNPHVTDHYTQDPGVDVASIQKYFERPVIIASGVLGSSPGALYSYAFPDTASFVALFGPSHWTRLEGAYGVRGTLVFTVNVTASAFNQGILALAYQYGSSSLTSNIARHNFFPLVVNLPHVKLNIAEATMAQLEVPFVSTREFINVESTDFNVVAAGIFSLVNLTGSRVVAGQDQPNYTVYVSMKDMELIGAVPFDQNVVTLQSGVRSTNYSAVVNSKAKTTQPSHVTAEARSEGLVSGTLSSISRVGNALTAIPGLNQVGGMTSWFADIMSNTAKAFGYSKPLDETMQVRHSRYAYALDGQVDVPSNGIVLSPFQGNKVAIDASVGITDEDEMCFDYILSKYQYIYRGNFSTTNAISDVIYACPVCPTAFWYRDAALGASVPRSNKPLKASNAATENAFLPSTLCYVGDNFRWWRGNIKFKFTFAKTKLHGGRIQATFVPYLTNPASNGPFASTSRIPNNNTIGPTTTGYTYIFDLRDSDSFEFEVPFMSSEPYVGVTRSIGDVSLMVVAPLKTNPSAPSTVDFMVEVCAMPGFEFAVPAPSLMSTVPTTGTTVITYQSGVDMTKLANDASQGVIGERFTSVKQIIMQPDYFVQDVVNASIFAMHFDHWFKANTPVLASPMSTTAQALWFASRSSRMAGMYSFCRGGTMAIVQKEIADGRVTMSFTYAGNLGGSTTSTFSSFYDKTNNVYSTVLIPETLEATRVKLPLFSNLARIGVFPNDSSLGGLSVAPNTQVWDTRNVNVVPVLRIRNTSGLSTRVVVGRAAADDAILARFIGPPPCIVLNSLATVPPVYGAALGSLY